MKALDYEDDLKQFLDSYRYQPELTKKLDGLRDSPITQEILNEIVLWKVNRYVLASGDNILRELDELRDFIRGQHRQGENVLRSLLSLPGVDLPMASTILRFRNPSAFQIIDRHGYRAVYGQKYPIYPQNSVQRKLSVYFDYIDALIKLCDQRNLEFETIDRVLYVFDKRVNGKL